MSLKHRLAGTALSLALLGASTAAFGQAASGGSIVIPSTLSTTPPSGAWTSGSGTTSSTANTSTTVYAAGVIKKACYFQNTGSASIVVDFGGGTPSAPVAPYLLAAGAATPCVGILSTTAINVWSPTGTSVSFNSAGV